MLVIGESVKKEVPCEKPDECEGQENLPDKDVDLLSSFQPLLPDLLWVQSSVRLGKKQRCRREPTFP